MEQIENKGGVQGDFAFLPKRVTGMGVFRGGVADEIGDQLQHIRVVADVVEGVISEEDLETEDYPCEGTIKHWKWWMERNRENMEGQIRSAAQRFLDYEEGFLKTRESLLEGLKERISPGWLKAAARFIYNAGGRIQPYPNGL